MAIERPVRTVVIVAVLPLAKLVVEQVNIVGHAILVQQLIKLLVVDAMGSFHFAVQMRRPWPDVNMADVRGLEMPVESRLKFRACCLSE